MTENYTTVTELPGNQITGEQLARLYQRYRFAQQFCNNREVLELACGGGMGLGYLAKVAKRVVGGDIDKNILKHPIEYYKGREKIEIREFNAQNLPFENKSFDVVILYEAIYYLKDTEKFVSEAHRVLKDKGVLLICTANKNWTDFNPSPYSTKYLSAPELYSLMNNNFSKVELFGAFSVTNKGGIKNRMTSFIKRTAISLNLMPKTMKGKAIFKRLFFGQLIALPPEIEEGLADYSPPIPISSDCPNSEYKVLFSVAFV